MKSYIYSSSRDRRGLPAWKSLQTGNYIGRRIVAAVSGLTERHVLCVENAADGYGYMDLSKSDRVTAEDAADTYLAY